MSRREKLFWLCACAALIVLFLSIIPSHYEICDEAKNLKKEHCTSYQVAQFLWIKIPQFFDVHNWLVTALFAGLVTLFTWRLWQATNELRVSTDNLWDVARKTADAQERDTKILQRAYLSVEPLGIQPMKPVAKFSVPHIQISNVGKLPAKHVRWRIYHAADEDHDRKVFRIDEDDARGDVTLSPGVTMQQGGALVDADTELKLPFGWYIYVWGAAYYEDGFGEPRITRFCHRYNCANVVTLVSDFIIGGHGIDAKYARYNRWGNDAT